MNAAKKSSKKPSASGFVPVERTRLKNGVTVVVAPMPHHARCHVFAQVRGGPVHESDKTWGLSHLVEHMVFRGTSKHKDSHAVSLAADDFGGDIGAATWRDRVAYDTRVDPDRVKDAFDVLALMLGAPRLEGLAIEQGIIESELAEMYDDDGNEIDVENAAFRQVFAGHPLSRTIEGTPKKVRSYDKAAVKKFHAACYGAQNIVVSVAGPVDVDDVFAAAAATFGAVDVGVPTPLGEAPRLERAQTEPLVVVRTEDGQTDVRVSFRCAGMHDAHAPALAVIGRLLDDGPASRIQREIIDERGLAYAVWGMADLYEDRGVIELGAEVQHEKVGVVVDALVQQVEALRARPPTPAEIARVHQRYRRDLRDLADEPSALAEAIGKGEIFRQPWDPAAHIARIEAVDVDAVLAAAAALADPLVTLVGLPRKKDIGVVKEAVARLR